ncbi:hypothetical protein PQX77_010748 [Marasmius sp. AFHP31]|nr:hypothetical protein PQX77_010748 [Marasmius sp. AFHP31]
MTHAESAYMVEHSIYSNSPSFSPHVRHYPPSYTDPPSYNRLAASGMQQYDLPADVVPSLSRMKRASSSSTITPIPPPTVPHYQKSHSSQSVPSLPAHAAQASPVSDSFNASPEPPRRKSRQKPKIELSPDQPTTTQGKQRKRVYVACLQWYVAIESLARHFLSQFSSRTRKIRCDGAKPVCHNCHHRTNNNGECNYDAVPRRRGPDKTPGARQRTGREIGSSEPTVRRRRRRRETSSPVSPNDAPRPSIDHTHHIMTDTGHGSSSPTSSSDYIQSPMFYTPIDRLPHSSLDVGTGSNQLYTPTGTGSQFSTQSDRHYSEEGYVGRPVTRAHIRSLDNDEHDPGGTETETLPQGPSLHFAKKVWYDSLCSIYASAHSKHPHQLATCERDRISRDIYEDLRFFFRTSNYWFSFIHLPTFFGCFSDPVKRAAMQPSLVLASLSLSIFWQSSEIGRGAEGRGLALRLRNEAQSALEASFNSGWIDESLAQASWLLALFEICAHPEHSRERSVSAVTMLDSIIRALALTDVDRNDPQASVFKTGDVPSINQQSPTAECGYPPMPNGSYLTASGCTCKSVMLGTHWPQSLDHVPFWAQTPAWDPNWSEAEIKKESCRRLCWFSNTLAAGHVSYALATKSVQPNWFIGDPSNYALLFSGEAVNKTPSSKDSVWALYDRCVLLWNSCAKMRGNPSVRESERADFAVRSWIEAEHIENALNKHTCGIERAFIFAGREYLFNTRMYITYEFQRYVPLVTTQTNGLFNRKKAEEWLTHQTAVAQRIMLGLHAVTGNSGNLLARRPFFTLWFMGQVSSLLPYAVHRALSLWRCDQSMVLALDVCKAFLPAID